MITEQDIFNFIFFPHLVNDGKRDLINNNSEYNFLVDFYKAIKSDYEKPLSESERSLIASKIGIYNHVRIFRLISADENKPKKRREYAVLAAASEKEKPAVIAKSFIDESNRFLIRVVKSNSTTKIYTFSTDGEVIQNFKLKILPSCKEFLMKNNSAPLEINEDLDFEEIQIELV